MGYIPCKYLYFSGAGSRASEELQKAGIGWGKGDRGNENYIIPVGSRVTSSGGLQRILQSGARGGTGSGAVETG